MSIQEQIQILEDNLNEYGQCNITIEEYNYLKDEIYADGCLAGIELGKKDAIDEYKNKLWEDIETRYKNDIKILGYLSAENLLRDVHNAICYFAEQLKENIND